MTYTKRAVALLLALMMVFTGAVQAFAATQMTMAVIALPRSTDIEFNIKGEGYNTTVFTEENGEVLVEGLAPGEYTITEASYSKYKAQQPQTVIVENGKTTVAQFHNEMNYGALKIVKTAEDRNIKGIEFIITGNGVNESVTTDENGVAVVSDLMAGEYTVTEKTPDGYVSEEPKTVTVAYGETSTVEFYNKLQRGDIEVTKTSEDGLVEGVKFKLSGTSTTGIEVEEYAITNEEGITLFEDIPIGESYVLEEVDTAERYVVPAKQDVKVEWEYVTEAAFNNVLKKFNLVLTKTDAEKVGAQGDATLEGAVYGIYKDGELLKSYTTDANGKFTTDYFVCGEGYTVKEITSSKGYLLDETVYTLDVAADNYTIEKNTESLAVTEQIIKGTVQLTKVDKDFPENKLTGAEFEVYVDTNNDKKLDANDTLLGKLTESERGIYSMSGLVYGGYFVKETLAPKGFVLDSNAYYFEIAEDGKTVEVENEAGKGFVNVSHSGSLKIVKTSSDGKVEGFSFRVTSENGYDETFTTDKNGEIFIEDIRLGTYIINEIANGASSNYIMPAAKTANVTAGATTVVEMHNVLRETPKTGDTRMPGLWLGIATISTLGAATFFYLSNKKRRNER